MDPERFSQLFSVKLLCEGDAVKMVASPVNLLKGTLLETPVAPSGDLNDYDVSPDGMLLASLSKN